MTTDTPDNVIPFPAREREPVTIRQILGTGGFDEESPLRAALVLINKTDPEPSTFTLQLAIGCLCIEIARLKGEKLWFSKYFD